MTTHPHITTAGHSPSPADTPARTHADGPRPDTHHNEPERPITTWQGGEDFATTPPTTPQPGNAPPRSTEERLAHHCAFVTHRTPAIDTPATQVRTLMLLGRHQQTTAQPSPIVTGPAATGKTTALLDVGRTCHLPPATCPPPAPPGRTHQQVPVAYPLIPPPRHRENPRHRLAHHPGIPTTTRMPRPRPPRPSATPTPKPASAWPSSTKPTASTPTPPPAPKPPTR